MALFQLAVPNGTPNFRNASAIEARKMTRKQATLELQDVSKRYGEGPSSHLVLEQVNFAISDGEFVCLLGQSGCGKTTLLRIVAGLTDFDGQVLVDGTPIQGPGVDRSMVFQDYGLLPWRTVLGNVEFALEVRGYPKGQRRDIAHEQIERLGLRGFETHYPHQISGGMQQRVGLARALTKNPKMLLMDEPFAAVDLQTREYLQDELLSIWRRIGTTVLFVTHSIEEAVYLSDRVLVMRSGPGRVMADVPVDIARPRSIADTKSSIRYVQLIQQLRTELAGFATRGNSSDEPATGPADVR